MLSYYHEPAVIAWSVLAVVAVGFAFAAALLRLSTFAPRSRVVRYEPPSGISASLAAYLKDNGRCERAFATGIISLAEQSQLSIEPIGGSFRLTRLESSEPPSATEEVALVNLLFGKSSEWLDDAPLRSLAESFQKILDKIACPREVLAHLDDFGEFLSRTEGDRLSRQDAAVPHSPEKYGAYSVALAVEMDGASSSPAAFSNGSNSSAFATLEAK